MPKSTQTTQSGSSTYRRLVPKKTTCEGESPQPMGGRAPPAFSMDRHSSILFASRECFLWQSAAVALMLLGSLEGGRHGRTAFCRAGTCPCGAVMKTVAPQAEIAYRQLLLEEVTNRNCHYTVLLFGALHHLEGRRAVGGLGMPAVPLDRPHDGEPRLSRTQPNAHDCSPLNIGDSKSGTEHREASDEPQKSRQPMAG